MALVLQQIASWLYNTHNYRDPRLDHHPIVNYPFFGIITAFVFLKVVKSILPAFMKHKPPYNLKNFILVYNAFQILFNGFIVAKALSILSNSRNDPFECFESGNTAPHSVFIYYFYNKLFDLIETCVFVLRKKETQVSTLHLSHHMQILIYSHLQLFQNYYGPILPAITLNSAVHVIMYIYYSLTACGIKTRCIGILKKSITKIQLVQFTIVLITSLTVFFPDCKVPGPIGALVISMPLQMLIMFIDFYMKAYNKNEKHK